MSEDCRYTRERCARCGKSLFASYQEAAKEAKRMGRWKSQFKGLKPYNDPLCHAWHLGDGGDHSWLKAGREKLARRRDWA